MADLEEVHLEGELTLEVRNGRVEGVEGECPLAVALRIDAQLHNVRRAIALIHVVPAASRRSH